MRRVVSLWLPTFATDRLNRRRRASDPGAPSRPLAIAALLYATDADALRCGSRLVKEGDHAERVLRYCGEPDQVRERYALRPVYWQHYAFEQDVLIEEWIYDLGSRRFARRLTFENGYLVSIERLGY